MMISYFQAVVIGTLQGLTELFPVSSLGHSVILPHLLSWSINQNDPFFLTFLVATHTATALVLFAFFWKDWWHIGKGVLRSIINREISEKDSEAKLGWLLIVGTLPAGILGVILEQQIKVLFANPTLVAFILMLNGLLLAGAEILRRRAREQVELGSDTRIAKLSWAKAIKVGFMQCLALIPGFSRTGSTITGGLLVGLSHEDSARFSFLLATPIIAGASLLKLPDLLTQSGKLDLGPILAGSICAGVAAYLSVKFLTKYFETNKLSPFAIYCFLAGLGAFLFFILS